MISADLIRACIQDLLPDTEQFLSKLVRFPSLSGKEHEAMLFLGSQFRRFDLTVEQVLMSDALREDPDYSDPVPDLTYEDRFNLRLLRKGIGGGGRSLLFNAHADVVPASEGMLEPWSGRVDKGILYGRGACDAKGQVATLFLVFGLLDALGIRLRGDVLVHLVTEEENGGNGTLAMVRRGESAAGCVVLEPSDHRLYTSVRGAVWFRILFEGKAGHSGQVGESRSALLMARDAMQILESYQEKLLNASRSVELFDGYANPMPITFGRLRAGNWPASAPSKAILEGVSGFLPNKSKEEVCREMHHVLVEEGDEFLSRHFDLSFMYRHDSSVLDPLHELPQTLLSCGKESGGALEISGMPASCDAWLYNNQLGIPTVVYGPGSLTFAHSKDEQIRMSEIGFAAEALVRLILKYCVAEL